MRNFSALPEVTRIETPRLLLRSFVEDDFPAFHDLLSCPRVMAFSATGVLSAEQSRVRLAGIIASYATDGFGKWAVVSRQDQRIIGYCGPELTAIDAQPEPELGFRFSADHWGYGYATEAAVAALDHCFRVLGFNEMHAFVEPANARSIRVLAKLGFVHQRCTNWQGHVVDVLRVSPARHAPETGDSSASGEPG